MRNFDFTSQKSDRGNDGPMTAAADSNCHVQSPTPHPYDHQLSSSSFSVTAVEQGRYNSNTPRPFETIRKEDNPKVRRYEALKGVQR